MAEFNFLFLLCSIQALFILTFRPARLIRHISRIGPIRLIGPDGLMRLVGRIGRIGPIGLICLIRLISRMGLIGLMGRVSLIKPMGPIRLILLLIFSKYFLITHQILLPFFVSLLRSSLLSAHGLPLKCPFLPSALSLPLSAGPKDNSSG